MISMEHYYGIMALSLGHWILNSAVSSSKPLGRSIVDHAVLSLGLSP